MSSVIEKPVIILGIKGAGIALANFLVRGGLTVYVLDKAEMFKKQPIQDYEFQWKYLEDLQVLAEKPSLLIDNLSWDPESKLEVQRMQEQPANRKHTWVSMVPETMIEQGFGLCFFDQSGRHPFAEIYGVGAETKFLDQVMNSCDCISIHTGNINPLMTLSCGLYYHLLAIWQAHLHKISPTELKWITGKASGFHNISIPDSLKNNPWITSILKFPHQLDVITNEYPNLKNLQQHQLLKKYSRTKNKKAVNYIRRNRYEANPDQRIQELLIFNEKYGILLKQFLYHLFSHLSYLVKERGMAPDQLDAIFKYAWGWPRGPFELWNSWKPDKVIAEMGTADIAPAGWIYKLSHSHRNFYRWEASGKKALDPITQHFRPSFVPEHVSDFKPEKVLWHQPEATVTDVGEGILNLEFHSRLNMMDKDAIEGMEIVNRTAKEGYRAIVITNNGQHFTVGVNLGVLFMLMVEQKYDRIDELISLFQNRLMAFKYASVPVVMGCQGYTIGGGTEMMLHLNKGVVAHRYAQPGLVEVNAGLIPGGGGTKELAIRAQAATKEQNWQAFITIFSIIASGAIDKNAFQAVKRGLLPQEAPIVVNQDFMLNQAKRHAIRLSDTYQPASPGKVVVAGKEGIEKLNAYLQESAKQNKWSKKRVKVLQKAAFVFCGGPIPAASTVTEQHLLDLEREAFLSLCGEKYTLQQVYKILNKK